MAADEEEEYEDEEDLRNDQWFKENYLDLIEQHPREWIAVSKAKLLRTAMRLKSPSSSPVQKMGAVSPVGTSLRRQAMLDLSFVAEPTRM